MNVNAKDIWKVLKTEKENNDVTSLYLEEGDYERFKDRRAGQYVSIRTLSEDKWSEPHPFTISCAPEDKILRLTIKKAGRFTSAIPDLKPGTPVKCAGPFGDFCKDIETKEEIIMIAGGIGITPFLSVLRHFVNINAKNKVKLSLANKTIDDAFAEEELKEMTKLLNLKVVHALAREKEVDKYFDQDFPEVIYAAGYVTRNLLKENIDWVNSSFYLCGPPPMQNFVLGELEACGIDPESVEKEKFSFN